MNKRIVLACSYQGSNYLGWQKQQELTKTIQQKMEEAIAKISLHPVNLVVAGRTDKGVHALRQLMHFDTTSDRPESAWIYGVNRYLPSDIAVYYAKEVPIDFHARFSALCRYYRYVLYSSPIRPVTLKNQVGWSFLKLNVEKMHEAIQVLVGKYDFSSFRSADCQAHSPIRNIKYARVYNSQGLICLDIMADGFLHHMIRNILGALLYVGTGRWKIEQLSDLLIEKSRRKAPPTFMADGLYFLGAKYPEHYGINLPPLEGWFWGDDEFISQN